MRMRSWYGGRAAGGAAQGVLWLLCGCVVVGALFFVVWKPKPPKPAPVVAIATPAPATPAPATPEPVVVRATPTPAPLAVATPTPAPATPPPLDMVTVSRTPALWPPQVLLVQPTSFPLNLNGRVVGEAKAAVGTPLRVLRVGAQQVEVEYQAAKHVIPVVATDLYARALATFRQNGSVLPTVVATATPLPVVASAPPPDARATTFANPVKWNERLLAEVTRNKRSRIEGGDYDDKRERIEMKVKVTNSDNARAADKFKGEIYVFAESILDRTAVKLLNAQQFDFSLQPRAVHEFVTDEVVTMYDTTDARFGHKYEGWVLRIRDASGAVVMEKATSTNLLKGVEKASGLTKEKTYDRATFKEKPEARAR